MAADPAAQGPLTDIAKQPAKGVQSAPSKTEANGAAAKGNSPSEEEGPRLPNLPGGNEAAGQPLRLTQRPGTGQERIVQPDTNPAQPSTAAARADEDSQPPAEAQPASAKPPADIAAPKDKPPKNPPPQKESGESGKEKPSTTKPAEKTEPSLAESYRQRIDAVIAQEKVANEKGEELQERNEELAREIEEFRVEGMEEEPPYSLLLLDHLRDQFHVEEARAAALESAIQSATVALDAARQQFEEKERVRRQLKEKLAATTDEAAKSQIAGELSIAELESKLAEEQFELRQVELANEKLNLEIQQHVLTLVREKIVHVAQAVQFTEDDLQAQLAELSKQEFNTRRAIDTAELNLRYVEDRWAEARRNLDAATEDRIRLTREVEAWRLARRRRQEELALLNRQLQRLGEMRTAWNRRYELAMENELDNAEMQKWIAETDLVLEQLKRDAISRNSQVDQLRRDAATVEKQLADAKAQNGESMGLRWLEQQRLQIQELLQLYEAALLDIEASERLHQRLLAELQKDSLMISPLAWLQAAWRGVLQAWDYELASVEDRPITVGKVGKGLLFCILGIWFSALLSRFFERRLRRRWKINRDGAAALKTLTFYLLMILVVLFALRMVNVPLTVFTVAGGALALGVGLGSQGLINNFLSGLVILAERPLRIGERIIYSGYDGMVEEVGFRCTKVRTLTGNLVTIPNSNIINETVENIGRRPFIRRLMNVTITYDTPRAKVEEAVNILRGILAEPEIVDKIAPIVAGEEYPPRVFFNEFNADSLNLIVIYWFAPPDFWGYFEHAQKVNLRIFEEFERAGIDFAFPTQTLHLANDEKRQLAVRMLGADLQPASYDSSTG